MLDARTFIVLNTVIIEWILHCSGMTVTNSYDFNMTTDVTPEINSTGGIASTQSALMSENTTISTNDVNITESEMTTDTAGILSTQPALMSENITIVSSTGYPTKPEMNNDTSGSDLKLSTYMDASSSTRQVKTISNEYTTRKTVTEQMTDKSTNVVLTTQMLKFMTSSKMTKPVTIKSVTSSKMTKPVTTRGTSKMMEHTTTDGSGGVMKHTQVTTTIVVSVILVVCFIVVSAIIVICILRRLKSKSNKSRLTTPGTTPIVQSPHVQLDFENLNDASTPGEFLLDKSMIDLEAPPTENEAVEAVTLLENAVGDYGSKEITTFHSNKENNEVNSAEARNSVNEADTPDASQVNSAQPDERKNPDSVNTNEENKDDKNTSLENKSPLEGEIDKEDSENLPLSGNAANDPKEQIPLSAPTVTPDAENPNPSPQENTRISRVTEL